MHLHCFTGDSTTVKCWTRDFPNCYFGFTAFVSSFAKAQIKALREVPENRLLLETDSPYFPVTEGYRPNTPAFIGDVAVLVAGRLGLALERLLDVTADNTRRLYGFD